MSIRSGLISPAATNLFTTGETHREAGDIVVGEVGERS